MAEIYARNKEYSGVVAGVKFRAGKAETDNKRLIAWFREKGYAVIEAEVEPVQDIASATVKELKDIAKEKGIAGYSSMKKSELIQALSGGE